MRFPKQIVDEFVSWIDLKDVQEYVMQLERTTTQKLFFNSLLIETNIKKLNKYDFIIINYGRSKTK